MGGCGVPPYNISRTLRSHAKAWGGGPIYQRRLSLETWANSFFATVRDVPEPYDSEIGRNSNCRECRLRAVAKSCVPKSCKKQLTRRVVVGEWLCSDVVTAFLQILFSIRGYNSIAYSFKELHKSDLVDLRLPWSTRRARVRGRRVYFIRLSIETNSTQGGVRN